MIVRGVETAVNTLHEKGIAHGDISDTNIMVDADGTFKIIDPLRLKSMEISRKFDQEALKELRRSADHLDHLI
jgi:RIO-like serine/threonine protein kinase